MKTNKDNDKRRRVYVQVRDADRDERGKTRSTSITVYDATIEKVVAVIKKAVRAA